jgi:hypothetical protein
VQDGKEWQKKEYIINKDTFILNKKISDNEFSLDLPEGIRVIDKRQEPNLIYSSAASGTLSLANGGCDLANMNWLELTGKGAIEKNKRFPLISLFCICLGIFLICYYLYRQLKQKLSVLIFLLLLPFLTGCERNISKNTIETISVAPSVLDFGKVRSIDSPIIQSFTIVNKSTKPITIKRIRSGCNCTVANVPQKPLLSNEKVECQVKTDILGRKGTF